jgi:murein DD-endopeptidase MepM/ murein hydrolase activator NlpD
LDNKMQHPAPVQTYDASDPFGSMAGRSYGHTGSDYVIRNGTVESVAPSVVYHTGWNDGNGYYVCVYVPGHDWDGVEGGLYVAYLHLSEIHVTEGSTVEQGQAIGISGNTGSNSRGEHLHVTMSNSDLAYLGIGNKVDPFAYIQARLGSPVPPKPVEPPKPTPVPPTPAGPPTPVKLTPEQRRIAIAKQQQYLKEARANLAKERRLGPRKDERKMAKYREQIARAQTRIKNIRRNGY